MKKILVFLFCYCCTAVSQQFSIEQYLNIRGAGSPQFSADDNRIYFTQSVTGTSQIWMVENPGTWPFQVTYFNDRVSSFSYNPKREIIVMEKDAGGSEYDMLFLLKSDGTLYEQLTESKSKVLYSFGDWFPDGSAFTYFTNERNLFCYDIFRYNIDNHSSEQLFSSDHSNYPSVISDDSKYLVITRSYSSYDNDLILLNLDSREHKIITPHDNAANPAEFYALEFSKDSRKIYINTNYGREFYSLYDYDIVAGKLEYSGFLLPLETTNYDLNNCYFSADKSKMFLNYNAEGYDMPLMYDINSGHEIILPELFKKSNIVSLRFGNVTSKMLIGLNNYNSPSTIYQWDYNSGKIEQVTFPNLAGVDTASFVNPVPFGYKSFDGLDVAGFIYYPKNQENNKVLPCIILIHGGPEGQAKYGFNAVIQYFVNAGYIVAEPNIRGSTGYGKTFAALDNVFLRENSVKDIAWLVESLVSTGRVDRSKIAVYGGSYGGYMVLACLTLYPELFAAGVDIVGISNFITFISNTAEYRRNNRQGEYGSLENDLEFLKSISPVNKVSKIKAPLMIIHGKNDPRIPVGEAEQMYEAIINNGGIAELLIYDDEGHGIAKLKNRLDAYPKIIKFMDKYLK